VALGEFDGTEIRIFVALREPFVPEPGNSGVGKRLAVIMFRPPDYYYQSGFFSPVVKTVQSRAKENASE